MGVIILQGFFDNSTNQITVFVTSRISPSSVPRNDGGGEIPSQGNHNGTYMLYLEPTSSGIMHTGKGGEEKSGGERVITTRSS